MFPHDSTFTVKDFSSSIQVTQLYIFLIFTFSSISKVEFTMIWVSQWELMSFMFILDCLKKVEIPRPVKSVFCPILFNSQLHYRHSNWKEKQHVGLIAVLLCKKQGTKISLTLALQAPLPWGAFPDSPSLSWMALPQHLVLISACLPFCNHLLACLYLTGLTDLQEQRLLSYSSQQPSSRCFVHNRNVIHFYWKK